jgi:hypothetical protein
MQMFTVVSIQWWRKPKYVIPLVAAVMLSVATVIAPIVGGSRDEPAPFPRHETLRPTSPPPTTSITEVEQVCGRRPYVGKPEEPPHVTYHLTIQNTGEKTVTIAAAKLNIGRIRYEPKPYPHSNLHWHGCGDSNFNSATVCIPSGAFVGQSIPFEVKLELPPRSTRDMYLTVCRHHPEGKRDECFLAYGAVTFYPMNADEFTTGGLYFAGE